MIDTLLTVAGVQHRRGRFPKPPEGTYAVWFDDVETEGADRIPNMPGVPRIYHHTARVELYEDKPDDAAEAAVEAELDAAGLLWTKEDRYWLQDVQRYQVIYVAEYTTK